MHSTLTDPTAQTFTLSLSAAHREALSWLLKATARKRDDNPNLETVHVVAPGYFETTNGVQLHRVCFLQHLTALPYDGEALFQIPRGNYRVTVKRTGTTFEKATIDGKYPYTYEVTQDGNRGLPDFASAASVRTAHFSVDKTRMADLLSVPTIGDSVHVEVGQLVRVSAWDETAFYFGVLVPMIENQERRETLRMKTPTPHTDNPLTMPLQNPPGE